MKTAWHLLIVAAGLGGLTVLPSAGGAQGRPLSGEIKADGSSTVYLITEAMATHFKKQHPDVRITVGISGTGGGFKKFAAGETDLSNASRAIREGEAKACADNGIEYVELQVAWDGLAVVIHPENTWAKTMTLDQLKKIWHPDSTVKKWSDVDPSWPNAAIKLYSPGTNSGTFDYFTEAVNGKEKVIRRDNVVFSEDDNVLVQGVAGDKYAIGYFGLAYYLENKDKLGVVHIGKTAGKYIEPSDRTVLNRTYPLSRPLYLYVKKASLKRPEVQEFCRFYLRRTDVVSQVKYTPLTSRQQLDQQEKLEAAIKELK
jgi:phosphate transport system substrate-binding protein